MNIFGNKKNVESRQQNVNPIESKETIETVETMERPRICCIDIKEEYLELLSKNGFNTYNGSLGSKVRVPNTYNKNNHLLLLNYDFPQNLHEFDILLIDLEGFKTIDYDIKENIRENHTGKTSISLLSSYPETLFDPRPITSKILRDYLDKITNRKYLVLVFSTESYDIEYEPVEISENSNQRQRTENHNIYSFWNHIPVSTPKFGKEININKMDIDFQSLLEKYKTDSTYNQTFYHPTNYKGMELVKDENYFPLMTNMNGDIISYFEINEFENLILLPQIKEKGLFLKDFLTKIAPSIFPELFPFSSSFGWKNNKEYWLPNHSNLIVEKSNLQKEYELKLQKSDLKIEENLNKFSFLHGILTETGDDLVYALINYLKWLGFENIVNYDETKTESTILEEDIQIELDEGILIIECKGIGGTSTDSDCSQISKIKHRRCKERNKFDVYALYIVNHQRFLPPLNRQNPPFTFNQLEDAKSDERGLLTTWQLYNLYFEIENKIISKAEARDSILKYGLINFRPANLTFLYEPNEFFNDNKICIVNVKDIMLRKNQDIYIEKNGKFETSKLLDIQLDGHSVENCNNGELGLKFDKKIPKKSILWIKGSH
jgi:hypothetical protein